jgi:hypothetical protein
LLARIRARTKKCTRCGKVYPDEAIACAIDGYPLESASPTAPPPQGDFASFQQVPVTKPRLQTMRAIALGCAALVVMICFLNGRLQRTDSLAEALIQSHPVRIVASGNRDIFPKEWLSRQIQAKARPLAKAEVERTTRILNEGIKKYPPRLLDQELRTVYVLSDLSYRGITACGTYSAKDIYVVNQGETMGYNDAWVEATFHHEFSSLLLLHHPQYLEANAWSAVNPHSFRYGEDGVQAIKQHHDNQECDRSLCSVGFWCEYSQNSMEDDFNMLAERLFLGDATLRAMASKYPKIRKKLDLVIAFYEKLDPTLNQESFLSLVK